MHDMNFFSVYKKRRAKSTTIKTAIAILVVFLLILNGLLIGGSQYLFRQLEKDIQEKEDWLNDPATREAIAEAGRIREEVELLSDYFERLQAVGDNLDYMKQINSDLFDAIRLHTPDAVSFQNITYSGRQVTISAYAESVPDVMDMYHAFVESEQFVNVSLSGIDVSNEQAMPVFSLSFSIQEVIAP